MCASVCARVSRLALGRDWRTHVVLQWLCIVCAPCSPVTRCVSLHVWRLSGGFKSRLYFSYCTSVLHLCRRRQVLFSWLFTSETTCLAGSLAGSLHGIFVNDPHWTFCIISLFFLHFFHSASCFESCYNVTMLNCKCTVTMKECNKWRNYIVHNCNYLRSLSFVPYQCLVQCFLFVLKLFCILFL